MSGIIRCPECQTENPANAKFCRMCKHPLSTSEDEYTPNLFPDIALRPVAILHTSFVSILEKGAFFFVTIAFSFPIFYL